jgi:hypothetical protein
MGMQIVRRSERADKVRPKDSDTPLAALPSTVDVTSDDVDMASLLWDSIMGEDWAGLLDATPG